MFTQRLLSRKITLALITVACVMAADLAHATDDNSLSWNGVTLYGTVDIGAAYQNHGAPLSQDQYTGLAYLITKNSNKSITSIAPNALSQSKLGLKGLEPIADDLNVVFNLEAGFNPASGKLSDALGSLVHNNGVPQASQTTGADGSRAGQLFNGPAFVGLSSKAFGTLTVGRHNTLLTDAVVKYDPLGTSYAFSVLGAAGGTAGGGNTQDVRLDDSLKYTYVYSHFRGGVLYQFGHSDTSPGTAGQFDIGGDFGKLSIDAIYAYKNQAIQAASLSTAQLAMPGVPHDSLAATISDNASKTLVASYTPSDIWKISGGYERITYSNPSSPLAAGFSGLGGYYISFVSNTAYNHHKILQVSWLGASYQISDQTKLTGAWYHYNQNSFQGNGCSDNSASSCSGTLNAYSVVFDHRLSKRFDTYTGVMYSKVSRGLSSGYLFTSTYDPTVGFRFQF